MNKYSFSTLNDKDLEDLVCSLLSSEMEVRFQKFKTGRDGGIDLRYSTPINDNNLVVQVKHYLKSGVTKLIATLRDEKLKLDKLTESPDRYIIATSVPLSPQDKTQIKATMSPYIISSSDIYGQDDLNILLSKYPEVETQHHKLWLSSINVLQTILNNAVVGRSNFYISKIERNLGLYVITKSYQDAIGILRDNKILLITGTPGIGKTSLANLLTYYITSKGFQLVYINSDVSEAEAVFNNDHNAKQLFYFDDFLGSNYLDIIHNNRGKGIVNFVERIKLSRNKYFILTTRSTILNQAKSVDENIYHSNIVSQKYELTLGSYNNKDKARILYNHIFHSEVPQEYLDIIFCDKNYWRIIKHSNYNPRLIEFITNKTSLGNISSANDYMHFIMDSLNYPERIWGHAISNQLGYNEKMLLYTLLTMGQFAVTKGNLELAYISRINYEVKHNGQQSDTGAFTLAFQNLLDGYICNKVYSKRADSFIDFVNPSIRDYLLRFFNESSNDKWSLINSVYYIEQLTQTFNYVENKKGNINILTEDVEKYLRTIDCMNLQSKYFSYQQNEINLIFTNYICDFLVCSKSIALEIIVSRLKLINYSTSISNSLLLIIIFEKTHQFDSIKSIYRENWGKLSESILSGVTKIDDFSRFRAMFNLLELDYVTYREDDELWINITENAMNRIYKKEVDEIWENQQDSLMNDDDVCNIEQEFISKFDEISELIFPKGKDLEIDYSPMDGEDIDEIVKQNMQNNYEEEIDIDFDRDDFVYETDENVIDALFER